MGGGGYSSFPPPGQLPISGNSFPHPWQSFLFPPHLSKWNRMRWGWKASAGNASWSCQPNPPPASPHILHPIPGPAGSHPTHTHTPPNPSRTTEANQVISCFKTRKNISLIQFSIGINPLHSSRTPFRRGGTLDLTEGNLSRTTPDGWGGSSEVQDVCRMQTGLARLLRGMRGGWQH